MTANRREFLQNSSAAGLAMIAGSGFAQSPSQSSALVYVRRDVDSLAVDGPEMNALRQAIAAMKARPATDPTSWLFQANIHGTADATPPILEDTWATCQHGSFLFLSWHRMYLYFFERILRASGGLADFALPYWNYSAPAQRRLPVAFREPAEASNPLYVNERRRSINAGQPVPVSATGIGQALATIEFASPQGSGDSFGGQTVGAPVHFSGPHGRLEAQPHDVIHVAVGGSGWMSDPDMAARDPIFWLHHCNIDRLWNRWIALGGGRRNPVSNPAWMNTNFTFCDENRTRVTMSGAEVLDTVLQLGYRYDDDPSPPIVVAGAATEAAASAPPARVLATLSPTESGLRLGLRDMTVMLQPAAAGAMESAAIPGSGPVILSFDDIAYRRPVGTYYEVYLNQPQGTLPDPNGPYYAGNLVLFALGHAHADGVTGGQVTLDVTGVLARQRQLRAWSGSELKIDLHPSDVESSAEATQSPLATIGQVRLLGR